MKVSLIALACVGVLGFISTVSVSYAGEKEWFTEENVGRSFHLVESLEMAPDLGTPSPYKKEPAVKAVEQISLRKTDSTASFSAVPDSQTSDTKKTTTAKSTPAPKNQKSNDYKVEPGDTLIGIAEKLAFPKTERTRVAVALWKTNQSNFIDGNINGIIAGKVLQLQNVENTLAEFDSKSAYNIIQSQWREWKNRGNKSTETGKKESDAAGKDTTVSTDTGMDKTASLETNQG